MKLYKTYFLLHLESLMSYKMSFVLTTLGQFFVSFNTFLGVYFLFQRFPQVKGYSFEEVILSYGIFLLAFSLAECFFRGFDAFSQIISNGEFDRMLTRPRSLILQVLGHKIEFSRVGRMFQALVMFIYAVTVSGIQWSGLKYLTVFHMLVGGVVLFASLFVVYASFCFYTIEGLEFMNIFTDGAREYGRFPVDIYGKALLKLTTYVVPFALIQYYPFLYLLGRVTDPIYIFLPLLACLFALPVALFWRISLRHYQSTGS